MIANFAGMVDVLTAAQLLESAIHDATPQQTAQDITLAAQQIAHARAYAQAKGETSLAMQALGVEAGLTALSQEAAATSPQNLAAFQAGPLYAYQDGPVAMLYGRLDGPTTTRTQHVQTIIAIAGTAVGIIGGAIGIFEWANARRERRRYA